MYIVRILGDETTIDLGRRGENRALAIDFPIDNFIANYGDGTPSLVHLRPGDTEPYVCYTVSTGDGYLRWYITDTDTAKAGSGKCELRWNVDDTGDGDTEDAYDTRAKSIIYTTTIHPSLTDETKIPDPYKDWYDAMMEGLTPVLEVESNPVFNLLDRGSEPRKSVIYAGDKLNQDKYVVPGAWWSPGWDTNHPIEDLPAVPAGSPFRFTVTGLYESTYTSDSPNYLIRKVEAEVVYGGASTSRELNVWAQIVDTRHQTSADRMTFHKWYRIPTGGDLNILTTAVTDNTAKINIVTGSNTIKTLAASDDLAALGDGHYRLSSDVPINAPSGLASSSKYGYVTIQHRGAAAYTYYEYVAGNGNGTRLEHFHGWKSTATGPSITWINLDEDAPTIVNSGTTSSAAYTSLNDIPLNSVGQARFAASISPFGIEANLPYACFGSSAYRMIIVGRISAAENIYINTGNASSWYGWKQLQFATT